MISDKNTSCVKNTASGLYQCYIRGSINKTKSKTVLILDQYAQDPRLTLLEILVI